MTRVGGKRTIYFTYLYKVTYLGRVIQLRAFKKETSNLDVYICWQLNSVPDINVSFTNICDSVVMPLIHPD